MQVFFDVVVDTGGNPIAGAQVFVYDSLGVLATLYSDVNNTPQANPIITNADGGYLFYAVNGIYSVVIVAAGYNSQTLTGITISGAPSPGSVDIQEFSTLGSYTWTKPAGARFVEVLMYGGGGGGGSGRRRGSDISTAATGGSGGGAGARVEIRLPASALAATETVVVGAGGIGGAPQTTDATNGNSATVATASEFKGYKAGEGGTGLGGSTTSVAQGGSFTSYDVFRTGSSAYNPVGGSGSVGGGLGGRGGLRPGAGGGGVGFFANLTDFRAGWEGGLGGAVYANQPADASGGGGAGGTAGGDGGNGADGIAGYFVGGSGGGSGGCTSTAAGNGGNGGYPGGGGGGGAAASGAFDSGAGGNGGNGFVRVVTYL